MAIYTERFVGERRIIASKECLCSRYMVESFSSGRVHLHAMNNEKTIKKVVVQAEGIEFQRFIYLRCSLMFMHVKKDQQEELVESHHGTCKSFRIQMLSDFSVRVIVNTVRTKYITYMVKPSVYQYTEEADGTPIYTYSCTLEYVI